MTIEEIQMGDIERAEDVEDEGPNKCTNEGVKGHECERG